MKILETPVPDLFILEPVVFRDERGSFMEVFNEATYKRLGLNYHFVQDNQSVSHKGTLRGLHFQKGNAAQAKLVWVTRGKVLDVAVDLRPKSSTYKKAVSFELSDENQRLVLIPRGFAHGFVCLSDVTVFNYKCDNFYSSAADGGVRFDDPELKIDWLLPFNDLIISQRDRQLPYLKEIEAQL